MRWFLWQSSDRKALVTRLRRKRLPSALLFLTVMAGAALADETNTDRHAGYYYPPPASSETYQARAPQLPVANRALRVGFVTGLTVELSKRPAPIPYVIFAKGTEAEKLIIVALEDGPLDTLYRARAVFAMLTAHARLLPLFKDAGVEDSFTFFDLCRMLGFTQITVSDGKTWAHQIELE